MADTLSGGTDREQNGLSGGGFGSCELAHSPSRTTPGVSQGGCRARLDGMNIRSRQAISAILAVTAGYVGAWAELAPRSFYGSFPGFGRHWVSAAGPYNEHLTRDVGGLYLALLLVSGWAAVRPRREILALAGCAWLVFSVPHFAFHMSHLDEFDGLDKAGNIITLGGTVVLAALLLAPGRTREKS